MKKAFEADYNDLSENTKELFHERYQKITEIVLGCDQDEQEWKHAENHQSEDKMTEIIDPEEKK